MVREYRGYERDALLCRKWATNQLFPGWRVTYTSKVSKGSKWIIVGMRKKLTVQGEFVRLL